MAPKFFIKLSNAKFHTDSRRDSGPFGTWAKVRTGSDSRRSAEKSFDYQSSWAFFKTVLKPVAIYWDTENNGTTQCS
jgi:hypothetical protein